MGDESVDDLFDQYLLRTSLHRLHYPRIVLRLRHAISPSSRTPLKLQTKWRLVTDPCDSSTLFVATCSNQTITEMAETTDENEFNEATSNSSLLTCAFNQDGGCLAIGTTSGFSVHNLYPHYSMSVHMHGHAVMGIQVVYGKTRSRPNCQTTAVLVEGACQQGRI